MNIPSNAEYGEFLTAQPGWWIEVQHDDGDKTYEPVVAWQRVENDTSLAGGALFPVTTAGAICFVQFSDEAIACIPPDKMEWISGTTYRLKEHKK